MNVQPVSFAQQRNNSQPTFNGYVDKPVEKIIEGLTQMSMDTVVKEANEAHIKVDVRKLQDIKIMGTAVLKKFNHFMENLHEKTVLTLNNTRKNLVIKNKTMGTEVDFAHYRSITNNTGRFDPDYRRIDAFSPSLDSLYASRLKDLNDLANTLVKAPHKEEIDEYLFKQFTKNITEQASNTSFFSGLKTKRNARKADKLASELGQPTGWKEKLSEIRNNAILDKKTAQKEKKSQQNLAKANTKIAKDILNKK